MNTRLKHAIRFATLFAFAGTLCFAESAFGTVMQRISEEVQNDAKYVCVTILVIVSLGAAFGGTNVLRHFSGAFGGIIMALFATSLIIWMASLA